MRTFRNGMVVPEDERLTDRWRFSDDAQPAAFLVSTGEYSDYSVACVCQTRTAAEEVARRMSLGWQKSPSLRRAPHLDAYSVEEIPLVSAAEDFVPEPKAVLDPEAT